MTTAINCAIYKVNQGVIDMLLVKLIPNGHAVFYTQAVRIYQQMFNNAQEAGGNQHATRVFCDFVEENLIAFQRSNNNNEEFHEKLAVMVFNGFLDLGINLSSVSDDFVEQNIVWGLIGVTTPNFETWESYNTFAHRTGGKYMFIVDASRILLQLISSVLIGQNTLREAFGCNDSAMANRNDVMNEQDQATDGVGDLPFDLGLSE